jgi:hypothetical protein
MSDETDSTHVEMRNSYSILGGKPERKSPLGRPGRRREDDIKIGLKELGWQGMNWIYPVTTGTSGKFT